MAAFNIKTAMFHEQAFARWFTDRDSWASWLVFLSALFALPMTDEELEVFRHHTGRTECPTEEAREGWLICGRRAGKSFILALVAVYLACFREYRKHLSPGERGTILVIAVDRKQSRVIMRYIRAFLTEVPMLKRMVLNDAAESIELNNRVVIEVGTASFKSVRGYTVVAALFDELAFFPTDDSADPDFEILNAVQPGMATIPNSMLLCASSPHAKRGALFTAYERFFGKHDKPLVWKATTREMNPRVPQSIIDNAIERDASKAQAEYMAVFRDDLAAFISYETVRACVHAGVHAKTPDRNMMPYYAFCDPSGGSSDSMTLAISHHDGERIVLDYVAEVVPPFAPSDVVSKFTGIMSNYGLSTVVGDAYGAQWVRERFARYGVEYRPADLNRTELYLNLLPALNSGGVLLLDNDRLINQLVSLQRRVTTGGREQIDHPPNSHDDVANAVAGAIALATNRKRRARTTTGTVKAY